MATATLVAAGGLSILVGSSFLMVARAIARKETTRASRAARVAHATWWTGLGLYLAVQGGFTIWAGVATLDATAYLASRLFTIPLLCAGVWGITYHLTYLYTGSTKAAPALAVLFGAVAALFYYATFTERPALVVGAFVVGLDDSSPLLRVVYLLVGLPPIAASLAYLSLLRRIRDPASRYRIVLLAGSILAYVGSGLAGRLGGNEAVIFLTLVVFGGAAAAASLLAYYPPAAIRRRLHA